MDLRKLKTLIDLVSESGVAELEITDGEDHVRIVNRKENTTAPALVVPTPSAASAAIAAAAAAAGGPFLAARWGYVGSGPDISRWGASRIAHHPGDIVRLALEVKGKRA